MASPRQDRRTKAPNTFAHVGVTFPLADAASPTIVNEKAFRLSQLPGSVGSTLPGFASAHLDTENYPNAYLVNLAAEPGDNTDQNVKTEYHTLPGTLLTGYDQEDTYLLPQYRTTQAVLASTAAEPSIVPGQQVTFEAKNAVESEKTTVGFDLDVIEGFFITLPGNADIDWPRTLTAIDITWDATIGTGEYNATGTGAAAGSAISLNLDASGRGQGSASVLCEINPIFAPLPPPNLPIIDYLFFLPNPVTRDQILARASAIASIIFGTATTINDWPIFSTQVETFILVGEKVSVSCESVARCAVSLNSSGASFSYVPAAGSPGGGTNEDFGSTVRAVTLQPCIHGVINLTGSTTLSSASSASSVAFLASGSNWPGAGTSTPTTLTTSAAGLVSPGMIDSTPVPAIPSSGQYMVTPNTSPFKWGYSTVRARIIDMSIVP